MRWILNQVRTYRDWLMPADLMQRINAPTNYASSVHRYIPAYLVNPTVLFRIQEGGIIDPVKNYTLDSYLNDLIAEVFKTTYQGRKLNNIERDLQNETINQFIRYSSLKPASSGIRNLDFTDDIDLESEAFPCSHALCRHHDSEEQSFTRIVGRYGSLHDRCAQKSFGVIQTKKSGLGRQCHPQFLRLSDHHDRKTI